MHYHRLDICLESCVDDDDCPERYRCGNDGGYFTHTYCICGKGYKLSSETGECVEPNTCGRKQCGVRTTDDCDGTNCRCGFTNYIRQTIGDQQICVRRCSGPGDDCGWSTKCTKLGRGDKDYGCLCNKGYVHSDYHYSCIDTDECFYNNGICPANSWCENTYGSYKCNCDSGYTKATDETCTDIDECTDLNVCRHESHTFCNNTMGSFSCECLSGYYKSTNNSSCYDINECETTPDTCGIHSDCENLPGKFSCRCQEGYTLNTDENSACILENGELSTAFIGGIVCIGLLIAVVIVLAIFLVRKHLTPANPDTHETVNENGNDAATQEIDREHGNDEEYDMVEIVHNDDANSYEHLDLSPEYVNTSGEESNVDYAGLQQGQHTEETIYLEVH